MIARRIVALVAALLLLSSSPVVLPSVGGRAVAATPPFTPPATWSTLCDTMGGAGSRLRAGANCRWLKLDGVFRRYVVVVPPAIAKDPTAGWPLVFMLHGYRGVGERMMNITDWIEVGAREGLITVFPTSWRYRFLNGAEATRWATYHADERVDRTVRLDGYPEDAPYPARDTEFLRRIVADVDGRIAVNPRRVHVSGSSNGGEYISRIVLELADLVASVSCSGYCDPPPESVWPAITRPVPVLFGLGTLNGGILRLIAKVTDPDPDVIPLRWAAARPLVQPFVEGYLDAWGLEHAPTKVTQRSTTTTVTWRTIRPDALPGGLYRLAILAGAHHLYANGHNNPNHLSMAVISWAFFRSHPMP